MTFIFRYRAVFIACLCIFTVAAHVQAADINSSLETRALTESETASLAAGDTVIDVQTNPERDDRAMDVFGGIDIAAPASVIWDVMMDCDRADQIVKDMTSCTVLETGPDGLWDIREQKLKVGFLLPKTRSVFRSDYIEPHQIKISLAGGDMAVQQGIWRLTPLSDGVTTRVTYAATLRPKFPVPRKMLRKATRKDVPEILQNLRREAETDFAARTP